MIVIIEEAKRLQQPLWQQVDDEWHLIVGNECVAQLIPNQDGRINWLSLLSRDYDPRGLPTSWHAVDFETLEIGKLDIMEWWRHLCRGEMYQPNDEVQP